MTETEFLEASEALMQQVENAIDAAGLDVECDRSGNVLTIELDDGFQIVINMQTPTRQLWLASLKGGHHYERSGDDWLDTCSRHSISRDLAALLTEKLGRRVEL